MSTGRVAIIGLRFIAGAALACLAAGVALDILLAFNPAPNGQGLDLQQPMAALGLGTVAAYAMTWALGRRRWRRMLWTIRADLVILAGMAWAYWQAATWVEGLVLAGCVVAGLILHHVAHRHALGWIIDSHGERQKVEHLNRGNAIFTPTTRSQRLVEEAASKDMRRKVLVVTLVLGGGLSYLAVYLYNPAHWEYAVIPAVFGGLLLLWALPNLLGELLYQLGYQDMKGAKVLDPEPTRPGIEDVAQQMAHGDATVADQNEALNLLNPRR
jgi:hypothetical protein